MEGKLFTPIDNDNNKKWISCRVENNVFIGNGDETKFVEILSVFKNWVEQDSEYNR